MSDRTKIAWCDATTNPVVGCSRVGYGCTNCYAAKMAPRLAGNGIIDIKTAKIEAFDLNFSLGSAVKYLLRAGRKTADPREDLEKARWFVEREIGRLAR